MTMYQYPYGNAQQLNLDWILNKIQELESGGGGEVDLEEVANALVSASYNTGISYRIYDYVFYNNKLYRCVNDTTGAWNPSDWTEVPIGDDVSILTRLINTAVITDVKFDTSDTNGKLQQKYGASYHDVVEVDYTPVQGSKRPLSSNAGYDLNTAINSKVTEIPIYTGDLDIDSVVNYAIAALTTYGLTNKMFTFRANRSENGASGYFGTSAYSVLCYFSSSNYGYGLLLSDNAKNIASFRRTGGVNYITAIEIPKYKIERFYLNDETWNSSLHGMYYTSARTISDVTKILCVCLDDWGALDATDIVLPAASGTNKVSLTCNHNTFHLNSYVDVRITYI